MTANQIMALQKRNAQLEEEILILKSHCDIHTTLGQRLKAVEFLSNSHKINTLCRVLHVNRNTYYKYLQYKQSKRKTENRHIRTCIVELYAKTDKLLGCGKITLCLKRYYRINISRGRVYRLMKAMNLPKMSTVKPFKRCGSNKSENGEISKAPLQWKPIGNSKYDIERINSAI